MTVTEIRTPERKAPAPKAGSKVHSIYETIEALGGSATCAEVRELLPAAGGERFATNKETHNHVNSLAVQMGYAIFEGKFTKVSNANITDEQYGRAVYRLASAEHYETRRKSLLIRSEQNKRRRKRAEEKLTAKHAAEAEQSRIKSALQKLKTRVPEPDAPVPVIPAVAPPAVAPQSLTRTDVALITGTACFLSVSVYALLEQLL